MLLRIIAIIFLLNPSPPIIPRFDFNKFDTTTGTLIGRVRLTPDAPRPGVRVKVIILETGNPRAIQTDANGEYRFPLIPLGLYSIEASKEGYFISRPTTLPTREVPRPPNVSRRFVCGRIGFIARLEKMLELRQIVKILKPPDAPTMSATR